MVACQFSKTVGSVRNLTFQICKENSCIIWNQYINIFELNIRKTTFDKTYTKPK